MMFLNSQRIRKLFYFMFFNPRILLKKIFIRIASLKALPAVPVKKKINGITFEFDFSYDAAVKSMYHNDYEIEIVEAIKKYAKRGDVFLDIGANIGYISAIALGFVGKSGQVHSFEPVLKHFNRLKEIPLNNKDYNIQVNQLAIGEEKGMVNIAVSSLKNIGWNTIVPKYMSEETIEEILEVPCDRLDSYINWKQLRSVSVIKIDTEGFEFPVLKGLSGYLENTDNHPVIICEVAPSAYPLLGCHLSDLQSYMNGFGYQAYELNKFKKKVDISKLRDTTNVLFLPRN